MRRGFVKACFGATLVLAFSGCRQDMHNQPKYVPYRSSEFFPDGLSERQQVEGTVARGQLHEDSYFYSGRVGTKEQDMFPFPITQAVMERGRERYDIYCSPCHGRTGDGQGMIVHRGYRRAADFHDQRIVALPVGHYFDIITHGFGAMPDYAAQIEPADRWAIAAYIRALQYAQNGTMAEVPGDQRGSLKDASQITVEGVSLPRALASGGQGSSEEISAAGANPLPASEPQQSTEGTRKK
ncbi:MAG: c-type cytochrome [Acidobacteria bacterium]|nr:c-type cytochrome [Acidobacteriota bacterium]MBV9145727.1 c-type cytochrome [Acidobacteriota bacterium]MBV9437251.1 c-type cytochrome [Acidobacteriota bacterium]